MATYRITGPDGQTYRVTAPDDATEEQVLEYARQNADKPSAMGAGPSGAPPRPGDAKKGAPDYWNSPVANPVGEALVRGARDIIDRPAAWLAGMVGGEQERARVEELNRQGAQEFAESKIPYLSEGLRLGGQMAVAGPLVRTIGAGIGVAAPQLGRAVSAFGSRAADAGMGTRMAGGAIAGGATAGLVDPTVSSVLGGAAIGGALPPVADAASRAGGAVADFVRPFTESGREKIAGTVLRKSAESADDAVRNLRGAREVVPGSAPTSAAASGDFGVASTLNAVQDRVPEVGAAARRAADTRNAARVAFGQQIGGTDASVANAKALRDAVTEPTRTAALRGANAIDAKSLTDPIDKLLANPQMQGETTQAALNRVRGSVARITDDAGRVDPRALYEVRKDINLLMMGKMEGEAANLQFARKQLASLKKLIDNRIDAASASPGAWKGYLSEYAGRSKEINQSELFQDVLRRSGAGTVDSAGNPMLYASKLNSILRNEGSELAKNLSADQMSALRRLASDMSAEQLAASASRSATLNSVTNRLGNTNQAIDTALGFLPGGGMLSRTANWAQSGNKEAVMGLLGDAVLSPEMAAYLMQQAAPAAARAAGVPLLMRAAPLAPGLLTQQ